MSSMYKPLEFEQPVHFEFDKKNLEVVQEIINRYPEHSKRSAIMPLLHLAQEQNDNWIPKAAMDYIAGLLGLPAMYVYEVANFYTMYNKQPVGRYLIQVCRTTPCWLRGADDIMKVCRNKLKIDIGETTTDKKFTLVEVECLAACVSAPVVQINNDYYENLTTDSVAEVLDRLIDNKNIKTNSKAEE